MAQLLLGRPVAQALGHKIERYVKEWRQLGRIPRLATVRVGQRGDDVAYEQSLNKAFAKWGIEVQNCVYPAQIEQLELERRVLQLQNDPSVQGILPFMPLPEPLQGERLARILEPGKDLDGVGFLAQAGLYGQRSQLGWAPCTAQACMELLDYYQYPLAGKHVLILGRSLVVGKPLAMLMLARNATVTICHSHSTQAAQLAREADILVAAIGRPRAIGESYLAPQQVVLDVGITFDAQGQLCGDVDPQAAQIVQAYTPVPGGIGCITNAVLALHLVEQCGIRNS